jgi:hypothetical protein
MLVARSHGSAWMDGWMSSLFQVIEQQQQKKGEEELKTKQRYIFSVHLKVYRII